MQKGSSLRQDLQDTRLAALGEHSTWVPFLLAWKCAKHLPSNMFPNRSHKEFATTLRRVFVLRDNTVALLTRPTPYRTPGTMRNKLNEANPAWPTGEVEKRSVFVDIPIKRQTGAFYVGTFIRDPEKEARFLITEEFGKLSRELQTELVNLWIPADATPNQRQNALLDLKSGILSIPCVPLERVNEDFEGKIESLFPDAVRRDRPSLGQLDLDASGCVYPHDAWKRHFQELEQRMVTRELDADAAMLCSREAEQQYETLTAEIAKLKTLRMHPELPESSADPTSLSGPSSTNKKRRESFTSVPPLPPATFVTGANPAVLNSSASFSSPLPLPDATGAVPKPLNAATLQHTEESFGRSQTYHDLAPVPERVINGVPVALINCGYHPRRLARSLQDAIPPPQTQPLDFDPVRKCIVVPSCRIVWLDRPTSRYHRSRGLLLQNSIPGDDLWDWQETYDGTVWHGVYRRILIKEAVQFLPQDNLLNLPPDVKTSLSQAVPKNVREEIKTIVPEAASSGSSLDEAVWRHIIESLIMKIPLVLVSFYEIGTESLHAARLSRQGPGNLKTLFAADLDGIPHNRSSHMSRIGYGEMLEMLATPDYRVEVEEADLKDITNLRLLEQSRLTIEHEQTLNDSS